MLKLYEKPQLTEILQVCLEAMPDEREQCEAFFGEPYNAQILAARIALSPGPSWVLYDGEKPIVIAGFEPIRRGVWQDWMVSTPAAWSEQNWRGVTRHVRRVMNQMLAAGAHRLQCISLRSRIQAHRWYKTVGLKNPVLLESYGVDGQDALMFARIKAE